MARRLLIIASLLALTACSDFLTREPEDALPVGEFFKDEEQCRLYTNQFYRMLPSGMDIFNEGADIIIKSTLAPEVRGSRFVSSKDSHWTWGDLCDINFFLERADQCSDTSARREYVGLAKFFRAWFYYDKVRRFGDVPWFEHTLGTNDANLYKGRDSRVLIMQHVLSDIDEAASVLPDRHEDYRVTRWTALALKSRIFLFEGRMIAAVGAVVGILLGLLVCWLQQTFGLIKMGNGDGAFIINAYPVSVHYTDVLVVFVTVIIVSWLSVWYPVRYLTRRLLKRQES